MRMHLPYIIMEYRDIKMFDRKKTEVGSITLEATIFLTLFMLFYLTLMHIMQFSKAQVVLQYSINEVAKEISEVSYILTKSGITDERLGTAKKAEPYITKGGDLIGAVQNLGGAFTSNGDVIGAVSDVKYKSDDFVTSITTGDTKANVINMMKTLGANWASQSIIKLIAESEIEKQIELLSNKSANQYLQDLGIVDGIDGLDFSKSKWATSESGNMPVLEVTCVYSQEIKLGVFEFEPKTFKLTAKTGLW